MNKHKNRSEKALFSIVVLLLSVISKAQIDTNPIDYNNKTEVVIHYEMGVSALASKISSVRVIDARYDTNALGYYSAAGFTNYKSTWPKIYCIDSSLATNIGIAKWVSNYLQLRYATSSNGSLLVVLKKFWISPDAAPILYDNNKLGQPLEGWDAGIISKLEFYLQKENAFYPLFRLDSIFTFKDKLPDSASKFIKAALKNSLNKLYDIDFDEVIAKRRKLSLNDILISNIGKFELPILKSVTFKKGIFKNFEEFKNNSPSIIDYELREGKFGDLLYAKDGKNEHPERNAWGFCDGINLFINSGDKYSKLLRQQNTFYFDGIKSVKKQIKHDLLYTSLLNLATNTGRKKSSFKVVKKYYQIDMETGEVY